MITPTNRLEIPFALIRHQTRIYLTMSFSANEALKCGIKKKKNIPNQKLLTLMQTRNLHSSHYNENGTLDRANRIRSKIEPNEAKIIDMGEEYECFV